MKKICFIIFLSTLVTIQYAYSMVNKGLYTNPAKVPLTEALKIVEQRYSINFIYEPRFVEQKTIELSSIPGRGLLSQTLDNLLSPLELSWYNIDNRNFSIFPSKARKITLSTPQPAGRDTIAKNTISGRVLNELNVSMPFATVSLLKIDSTVITNMLTDTAGIFTFTNVKPGKYLVKASYSTYKNAYSAPLEPASPGSLVIKMTPGLRTLKEVRIVASRQLVETKSDRYVLNVANSVIANGSSIQLLKAAPFVKVSPDNIVTLQGKKTMILINNKPVPDVSLENILLTMPAENIQKIELITHPAAKYDAAYGAVINISTKKSQIEGFSGNVRTDASAGKYAQARINTSLNYKYHDLTVYGFGDYTRGDSYYALTSTRILGTNDPIALTNDWARLSHNNFYSFQFGASYQISKNQVLGAVVDGRDFFFKGRLNTVNTFGKQHAPVDSVLKTNSTFRQHFFSPNYNINYSLKDDSGKNEFNILTTYTPWKRNYAQFFPSVLYDANGNILDTPPTFKTTNIGDIKVYIAQADYAHSFAKEWRIETGLKYQKSSSRTTVNYEDNSTGSFQLVPEFSSDNTLDEKISSAYGTVYKDWKSDKFQAGLRAEDTRAQLGSAVNQKYFNLFPNASYQHNLTADINFSLNYKRTISRAPYYQLLPYSIFVNRYTVEQGNPALRPEYNNIFSIDANVKKVNFSLSYTQAKGVIALFPVKQDFDTKLTYFSRNNLRQSSNYALYLFFPLKVTEWWETENSGSPLGYTKARGEVLGQTFKLSSFNSDFRISNTFKISQDLKLGLDAYYWSSYVQDLSHHNGYKNIDASVILNVLKGMGQIRLYGYEVLLKRNDYHLDSDFGIYKSYDITNTDTRRIGLSFSYKFGKTKVNAPRKNLGNEDAVKRF